MSMLDHFEFASSTLFFFFFYLAASSLVVCSLIKLKKSQDFFFFWSWTKRNQKIALVFAVNRFVGGRKQQQPRKKKCHTKKECVYRKPKHSCLFINFCSGRYFLTSVYLDLIRISICVYWFFCWYRNPTN